MKSNSQKNAELTHRNRGGQHAFSFRGTPDHQEKPLIEGLFLPEIQCKCFAL
ncbi:hypothetical protein [Erwinia aphidicola]|uniref:hypothetical protein n=1 Tax=Erwinia aphidicola TaxID=68334 RepID=UPI0030CC4B87